MKQLSIVIPCFNSSENIADLLPALEDLKKNLSHYALEIILVDDGSKDDTYEKIVALSEAASFKTIVVKLSGNFGSYNAFLAGLNYGTGNVYAQLHPDLQDPPQHLYDMLPYWEKGIKLVIAQRTNREDFTFFGHLYHWVMKKIALPHIPTGGYDLLVFDRELRDHIVKMNESNTNLVYLISWLQYPYVSIPITRISRKKGKSQWTLNKKIKLWADSLVSFSYFPIRMITFSTLLIFLLSIVFGVYLFFSKQFASETKLLVGLITLFGNLLLIAASILAEYLWRTLEFSRKRPPFVVDKLIENKN